MSVEQTSAVWQCAITKPITVIPFELAYEGAKEAAFESKQDANRNQQLAWIQLGLRMPRELGQLVAHKAEDV